MAWETQVGSIEKEEEEAVVKRVIFLEGVNILFNSLTTSKLMMESIYTR